MPWHYLEKCMTTESLLRATRNVYLLVPKPGVSSSDEAEYWAMGLDGLNDQDIKSSVIALRREREKKQVPVSKVKALKITALQTALAVTLGARSYDQWREVELPRIRAFLAENGMTHPADLIRWALRPGFADPLTAQRLAERFFNSGLPLPKRLFTGVGSMLFAARGYGRMDIHELAGKDMFYDEERLEYCVERENEVVLRAHDLRKRGPDTPEFVDLTGRTLLLNAVSEFAGGMYNLLGDNLSDPLQTPPVFTAYDTCPESDALNQRIFELFRREIEQSTAGWVDVLPMPGNDNLVFLKGPDGTFDWVVRDQRDKPFTANPFHPIFKSDELPSAMQTSKLAARLYFTKGEWRECLEHLAERRHYAEGGSIENWPGYDKLILRELIAEAAYVPPRPLDGLQDNGFTAHRLKDRCLMISPLVTIDEFWRFYERSDWRRIRAERLAKAGCEIESDLAAVNLHDAADAPVSVTWFDAIAYCRHIEKATGLPVRLLDVEEWRAIAPAPARDIVKDGWGDLTWVVTGGDGRTGTDSAHRYPEACPDGGGWLRFGKDLTWSSNQEGLQFLSVVDFGEWLGDYASGYAAAANAATGKALMTGPLERDRCPARLTMRYKGLKVGFRLCYIARPDA
jgi:hypothetical protein